MHTRKLGLYAVTAMLVGHAAIGIANAETGVTDKAIVLGTTNPLSGALSSACKPVSDGALAWFAQVNAAGGVHGRLIENIVMDDQYQAPQALANARTFMRDGIFAMFGGCGSLQPAAVFPMMQGAGIPYVFPYTNLEEFASPTKKYTFAIMAINRDQITGLIKDAAKTEKPGSIVGLYTKYPGVEEAIAANEQAAKGLGGKWLDTVHVTPGATDFTPIVLKLKSQNPDYLVLNIVEPDAGRLFRAMEAQNWWPKKMYGVSALSNGALFDAMGAALNNRLVTATPTYPASAPEAAECVAALKKASVPVNGFSIFGCGTAQAFVHAARQTGKDLTREGFVKTLEGWRNEQASKVFPPITFSSTNHMGQVQMIKLGVADGKAASLGYFPTPLAPASK